MPPKSQPNGKAPRSRRTRAQIEADLIASGLPVASKPTAAAVKRSRLSANARSASLVPSAGKTTRDSPSFDCIDYQTIINFLSKPSIQNALFGGGSQPRVSGMPMGPKAVLTPLAIELNNDYNIRHNTTAMRLDGRVLHLRVKRYMTRYKTAHAFNLKTGSGLSAKNRANGINTMAELLDSMCPLYKEMDALFRDRGNITPFGILDTGADPSDDSDDEGKESLEISHEDSDGNITDGHDHVTDPPTANDLPNSPELGLPEPNSVTNPLNDDYREFIEKGFSSPHPTPDNTTEDAPVNHSAQRSPSPVQSRKVYCQVKNKSTKKRVTKHQKMTAALTAEERALDDTTSDEEALTTATTSATASKRSASRSTLSRRGLEPLPSIDPSHVHSKDHKHALASAIQQGNEARLEMINKANALESARIQAEQESRASDLSWAKERYFLDREEQREAEARRLTQESQKERKAFCERLVMEGKTPQELEAYLALVYPAQEWV